MASSVVGTCTTRTPRSQVAATNPARSVTAPPPTPTTASERVKPACPSTCQQKASDRGALRLLRVGNLGGERLEALAGEVLADRLARCAQRPRVDDEHLARALEQRRELAEQAGADDHVVPAVARPVPGVTRPDPDPRRRAGAHRAHLAQRARDPDGRDLVRRPARRSDRQVASRS